MSTIRPGMYLIRNTGSGNWVGTGPVPRALIPFQLRGTTQQWASKFRILPQRDNTFEIMIPDLPQWKLRHNGTDLVVHPFDDMEPMAIEPSGSNQFHIHLPNGNMYWTLAEDAEPMTPISLEGNMGRPGQKWELIHLDDA